MSFLGKFGRRPLLRSLDWLIGKYQNLCPKALHFKTKHIPKLLEKNDVPTESEAAHPHPDWMSWAGAYEGDMMLTGEQVRQLNDVCIYIDK